MTIKGYNGGFNPYRDRHGRFASGGAPAASHQEVNDTIRRAAGRPVGTVDEADSHAGGAVGTEDGARTFTTLGATATVGAEGWGHGAGAYPLSPGAAIRRMRIPGFNPEQPRMAPREVVSKLNRAYLDQHFSDAAFWVNDASVPHRVDGNMVPGALAYQLVNAYQQAVRKGKQPPEEHLQVARQLLADSGIAAPEGGTIKDLDDMLATSFAHESSLQRYARQATAASLALSLGRPDWAGPLLRDSSGANLESTATEVARAAGQGRNAQR